MTAARDASDGMLARELPGMRDVSLSGDMIAAVCTQRVKMEADAIRRNREAEPSLRREREPAWGL